MFGVAECNRGRTRVDGSVLNGDKRATLRMGESFPAFSLFKIVKQHTLCPHPRTAFDINLVPSAFYLIDLTPIREYTIND